MDDIAAFQEGEQGFLLLNWETVICKTLNTTFICDTQKL